MRSLILLSLIGLSVAGTEVPAYVRNAGPNFSSGVTKHVEEFWPNGNRRRVFDLVGDLRHGEYRTWSITGAPYELKHFNMGREEGLQQAWDENGQLYLNYEMRNGRRYGLVNAKPCPPPS